MTYCGHKDSQAILLDGSRGDAIEQRADWMADHPEEVSNLFISSVYATVNGGYAFTVCPEGHH